MPTDDETNIYADTQWVPTKTLLCYSQQVATTERQLLDALSRTPFVDSTELALMLVEPHATVHRNLAELLAEGIVVRERRTHASAGVSVIGVGHTVSVLELRTWLDEVASLES